MTVNLWEEIIDMLEDNNKTWDDVITIQCDTNSFDKNVFRGVAKSINYDPEYGNEQINLSLKIIGDNWWLERHSYVGSEWWEYKSTDFEQTYNHITDKDTMKNIILQ